MINFLTVKSINLVMPIPNAGSIEYTLEVVCKYVNIY